MKIGIVTFNSAYSYGAVLQAYALQTYLEKTGHEPFFINYSQLDRPLVWKPVGFLRKAKWDLIRGTNCRILHHYFHAFQRKVLNLGPCAYASVQQLKNNPPAADAYISGSDQIWHPFFAFSEEESIVWLNFGPDHVRRVSYAASFGDLDLDEKICSHWAQFAQKFSSISVREQDAVNIAAKLDRSDAAWVPDPTLLLTAKDYEAILSEAAAPSVFSYMLVSSWQMYVNARKIVKEELGGPLYDCRPTNLKHNLLHGGLANPGRWLSRIRNARFVLTDSFHGLLFSLIFHRPFAVLRSKPSRRIMSILKIAGMEERLLADENDARIRSLCCQEVDWQDVDTRIKKFREVGTEFIAKALS